MASLLDSACIAWLALAVHGGASAAPDRGGEEPVVRAPERSEDVQHDAETPEPEAIREPEVVRADADADAELDIPEPGFAFHGYLRGGFGVNGKGGDQEVFWAPGTGHTRRQRYRLGNEVELISEPTFQHVTHFEDGTWSRANITIHMRTLNNTMFTDPPVVGIFQAYAELGGVLAAAPEARFWAGKRFFRRAIQIDDLLFLEVNGHGGGITHLDVRIGELALAWLGASTDDDVDSAGRVAKNTLDARLEKVDVPGGQLTVDLQLTRIKDVNGLYATLVHDSHRFAGGSNVVALQLGVGAGARFDAEYWPARTRPSLTLATHSVPEAWRFRAIHSLTVQPSDYFSMMTLALVQLTCSGAGSSVDVWASLGARPIWHATRHLAMTLDVGVDHVQGDPTGTLVKLTVSPQIIPEPAFSARPAVRPYLTTAFWSDGLVGHVGGEPHAEDSMGLGIGIQGEALW